MQFKIMDYEINRTADDVIYTEIGTAFYVRYRLRIRSNSYREQCHARIDVWSPGTLAWNQVADVGAGAMRTVARLRHVDGLTLEHFRQDRETLYHRFAIVVNGSPDISTEDGSGAIAQAPETLTALRYIASRRPSGDDREAYVRLWLDVLATANETIAKVAQS